MATIKSVSSSPSKARVQQDQDAPTDKTLLERALAFVQLRFPEAIKALEREKDEKVIQDLSIHNLQEYTNFILGQMDYEDAMEFVENTLHQLQMQKWDKDAGFQGDMSKQMKLIKFKPTHEAFRKL